MFKITVWYSSHDPLNRTPRHYLMPNEQGDDRCRAIGRAKLEAASDEWVQAVSLVELDCAGNDILEWFPEVIIREHWENTVHSGNLHRDDLRKEKGFRSHQVV